jgi:hypothetical protein
MKQMTKKILINLDQETLEKLDDLAKDSDKSKAVRRAVLLAWDVKNGSVRVPKEGYLSKYGIASEKIINHEPAHAKVETFPSAALTTDEEL